MSRKKTQATIPDPVADIKSLRAVALATKEIVEVLDGQRGDRNDHAVTWGELPPVPYVGDQIWSLLPFVNGWTNYGTPFTPCGFRKLSSGLVLLRGLVKDGSAAHICTLPAGYRPGIQQLFASYTSPNTHCRIDVATDGAVSHYNGVAGWISLSNVCFFAEN